DGRRAAAAATGIRRGGRAQRGIHRTRATRAAGGCRVTTPSRLRIAGGTVYDPANGVDGAAQDVCIEGDRIVAELPAGVPRLDVRGMVVMPGGVDIHAHVAGSSVNHARRLLPEEHAADPVPAPPLADGAPARSGTGGTVPSTFATGDRYAALGYTPAMEAAVAPLAARHAPAEPQGGPASRPPLAPPGPSHRSNLGRRGDSATTLEAMRALAGRRAHFTHLQLHSYGGERGKGWKSAARDVIDYVNGHAELSVDVGQVMFGSATTVTADGPVEHLLYASSGRKWVTVDIELETGCGIVPNDYRATA